MTLRSSARKIAGRAKAYVTGSQAKAYLTGEIEKRAYDSLSLLGRVASWRVRSLESIDTLRDVEFKTFSQFGEDGIIDWLIERANIPPHLQTFVEFGVDTYREANTRFLLQNRNWRGLILEGASGALDSLRKSD